jgi:trimethylamine--corrinoid protein Co-methyltransferase
VFADAGADVDGAGALPRDVPSDRQATAAQYIQHARNPLKNVKIGGNAAVFAPNYGSPFAFDSTAVAASHDRGLPHFIKLTYQSLYLHRSGGTVCGRSTSRSASDTSTWSTHLRYSDKRSWVPSPPQSALRIRSTGRIGFGVTSPIERSSPVSSCFVAPDLDGTM